MKHRKLSKGKPITESLLLQLMRRRRYVDVEQNKEDQINAFITESMPPVHPSAERYLPSPIDVHRQTDVRTTIEFVPQKISIPESEAITIATTVCLVHTQKVSKLYLMKNGEWQAHTVEPLMAKIIEHLFRWSAWPANRRGRKVSEMRNLCGAKSTRSADSTISSRIKRIEEFCEKHKIPPLIVQGEGNRWYFNKF